MALDVVLSPKHDIRLNFKNDSRHYVALTQREGSADGSGVFADAEVVEYAMHDVTRGDGAERSGYFEVTTTRGDTAYFRWWSRGLYVAGPDGEAKIIDKGYWELIGGTGLFASMRGVGTMLRERVSKTIRRYVLEGDISPAP